jgi:hypothetical protein
MAMLAAATIPSMRDTGVSMSRWTALLTVPASPCGGKVSASWRTASLAARALWRVCSVRAPASPGDAPAACSTRLPRAISAFM